MQIDFHYYCVAVLARASGFNSEDALTIAYASQYSDDATESEPIRIADGGEQIFDPVCTAYDKIQDLGKAVLSWSAQKRVYIPFHFIPPKRFIPGKTTNFSYVTETNSSFGQWLLTQAANEPATNYEYRLCRIGIALHTFADTWAHAGFSGRLNRAENDIKKRKVCDPKKNKWESIKLPERFLLDAAPEIGHAEAGYFPDLSFLEWQFEYQRKSIGPVTRNNIEDRLKASKEIYNFLSSVNSKRNPEKLIPWETLEPQLSYLFSYRPKDQLGLDNLFSRAAYDAYHAFHEEERCQHWRNTFGGLFDLGSTEFNYDKELWRKQAFEGDTNWDGFTNQDWEKSQPLTVKTGFWNSLWVDFHRAALRQRHLVLENIP